MFTPVLSWQILPPHSFGPIKLGMNKHQVKNILGEKVPLSMLPPHLHGRVECFVVPSTCKETAPFMVKIDYSHCSEVNAIEVRGGRVTIGTATLSEMPMRDLIVWLENQAKDVIVDEMGVSSQALGLGFYAPHRDREQAADAFMIFTNDYYEMSVETNC
jgi:hypothetical protein